MRPLSCLSTSLSVEAQVMIFQEGKLTSFPLQFKLVSATVELLPVLKRSSAQYCVLLILLKGQFSSVIITVPLVQLMVSSSTVCGQHNTQVALKKSIPSDSPVKAEEAWSFPLVLPVRSKDEIVSVVIASLLQPHLSLLFDSVIGSES